MKHDARSGPVTGETPVDVVTETASSYGDTDPGTGTAVRAVPNRPIARQSLGDQVAVRIKDYIIERNLSEGDRLPTEQQLADLFGVSRLSVREATRALAFLGILRSAPRRGLTIGKVDMGRVSTFLGFHIAASGYPRAELVRARMVIESGALAHAIDRIVGDDATYRRLHAVNQRLMQAPTIDACIAGDLAFHKELIACSQVGPLIAFSGLLEVFFATFKEALTMSREAWVQGIETHGAILDALRARDLAGARRLLEFHLSHYLDAPGSTAGIPTSGRGSGADGSSS